LSLIGLDSPCVYKKAETTQLLYNPIDNNATRSSSWGVMLSSRKKREDPWWYSPSIFQIIATDKAIRRCQLAPLLIQKILNTLAKVRYPTRPKRARKNWVENVWVDGIMYQLNCFVDEKTKMIVATDIRAPKEMRRPRKHT